MSNHGHFWQLHLGIGDKLDTRKSKTLPAGSFARKFCQDPPLQLGLRRNRDSISTASAHGAFCILNPADDPTQGTAGSEVQPS